MELSFQAWYTIFVVLAMFISLSFTKIRTEVAFLAVMVALLCGGVLDAKTTFSGFSSESVIVVAVLFVVISGLTYTKNLMGTPKTHTGAIIRLMLPVATLSSLLSNTTVVALFINVVKIWSQKLKIAPSRLLIPLSYASGMGGICTLIGTPPNLIISGLYTEETGIKLSILTPTLCGLFCLTVGVLSMIAMQKLLPERKSPMHSSSMDDLNVELVVPSNHPAIGMTVEELSRVYPVSADEFIMGGDCLYAIGTPKNILRCVNECGMQCPNLEGVLETAAMEDSDSTSKKGLVSTFILIAMVALSAFKVLPLLNCCLLAATAMIITRCCTSSQAMKSIDWNIIIVFAGSVCIGKAIEQTGIAQAIANGLLEVCGTNPYVVLFCMCLVATFITEFISNTAAGAMFYPIAMSAATALSVNPLTFCVALMIAASSSFATPIGSPTHTLVYVPGGYKFSDFMKVGIIMNFIILFANIFITTIVFPL